MTRHVTRGSDRVKFSTGTGMCVRVRGRGAVSGISISFGTETQSLYKSMTVFV